MTPKDDHSADQEGGPDVDRRGFLTLGAILAGAAGVWGNLGAVKVALAEARRQGKPLLTPANLQAFIRSEQASGHIQQSAAAAKANLLSFLQQHFMLTADQESYLGYFTAHDKQVVAQIADLAVSPKNSIVIAGPSPQMAPVRTYGPTAKPTPKAGGGGGAPAGGPGPATTGSNNKLTFTAESNYDAKTGDTKVTAKVSWSPC